MFGKNDENKEEPKKYAKGAGKPHNKTMEGGTQICEKGRRKH